MIADNIVTDSTAVASFMSIHHHAALEEAKKRSGLFVLEFFRVDELKCPCIFV